MPRRTTSTPCRVAIFSSNGETLDGLQQYLFVAGVSCRSYRTPEEIDLVHEPATVLILFPDELPLPAVFGLLGRLREARSNALTLLVTRTPARFREAAASDGRTRPPLILAKPVFGWTILEAIRAHSAKEELP